MFNNHELIKDYVALARNMNHQAIIYRRLRWVGAAFYAAGRSDYYMQKARQLKEDQPQ